MKNHPVSSHIILLMACALFLSACTGRQNVTVGRYAAAETGTFVITEDGEPLSMSDRSRTGTLFEGLDNGDRIEITHDAVAETFPGQIGVSTCKKLEDGTPDDLPADVLTVLEEMGYRFSFRTHVPAEEPQTADALISGYCGNTVTEIVLNGNASSFWGTDSVTLTDLLIHLPYDPDQLCRCLPEFTVNTEFGSGYGINLSQAYARFDAGQAALTAEQVEQIQGILERNCT